MHWLPRTIHVRHIFLEAPTVVHLLCAGSCPIAAGLAGANSVRYGGCTVEEGQLL